MSQFQILGRRPFPFKAIPIRFAYTNFPDTIKAKPRPKIEQPPGDGPSVDHSGIGIVPDPD